MLGPGMPSLFLEKAKLVVVQGQPKKRELKFKYRLTIENSKGEPVTVSLLDRIPHSDRPADVRVALGKMTDPLSEEKLYVLREKPKGILCWEVNVPADSAGADGRFVEYDFTVDFDRNFHLTALREKVEQRQKEFEELERQRGLKR